MSAGRPFEGDRPLRWTGKAPAEQAALGEVR